MTIDIKIFIHRDHASIIPVTEKGTKWLKANIDSDKEPVIILAEVADEIAATIQLQGLEVEVK